MKVGTADSSSVSVGNEYTDEFENPDTSDDTHFWRKGLCVCVCLHLPCVKLSCAVVRLIVRSVCALESVRRFTGVSSVARSGWHMCAVLSVTAVILLVLIITVSVSRK